MAVRGARAGASASLAALLALLLLLCLAAAEAEAAKASTAASTSASALCSKFPSYCDESDAAAAQDDKKGKGTHQRFAETKWRKPKGDVEIRGHLAPKRPLKTDDQAEIDEAAALRAATIREAEERMRLAEQSPRTRAAGRDDIAQDASSRTPSSGHSSAPSFDKRRTVEEARRKAHLIQEARRKRRQRLEEEEEDDDEDEMVVEVEEDEEEDDESDEEDDDAAVEDDESDEDEELESEELISEEEEEEEEEEYVEEGAKEEEEEEEEEDEHEEESEEELELDEEEPEDEEEKRALKKLRESVQRRRKWKEEEARMKRREEERKKEEEEKKKKDDEIRRRRIEEIRKKKRQEEEERLKEEEEEERRKEEEEEKRRREEEEEEERRKKERQERLQKLREEREKEERRRLEEKKEREEKRRREEEERKRREEEEERERVEEERKRKEKEEEERRQKLEEEERQRKEEIKRKEEEKKELQRLEAQERKKREEEIRLREEQEKKLIEERKKREEEERKRKEAEERERKLKQELERERKKMAEELERERRRREEEEKERKRREEEDRERRKREEEERKLKLAEEESRKKKEEEDARRKREIEEKRLKKLENEERAKRAAEEIRQQIMADEKKSKKQPSKASGDKGEVEDEKDAGRKKKKEPAASERGRDADDELDQTSWMSGFPEFFAPTADDDVKNDECKKHSRIFVQHLAKYKPWALSMYDATAKLPSGVLSGNGIQLGDFDECLGVDVRLRQRSAPSSTAKEDEEGEDVAVVARAVSWFTDLVRPVLEPVLGAREDPGLVHIRGRYCLAGLDLELRRHDPGVRVALDRALAHSFLKGSLNDSAHFVPRFRTLGWGVCVPEACAARDVEAALRGAVARFQRSGAWGAGLVRARLSVAAAACRVAPRAPPLQRLPPTFLASAAAVAALLLVALVATVRDSGHEPDELGGLSGAVSCFSLRRNWSTLTAPEDPGADDIRCIHGVRSVCSLLLYAAHKILPLAALPLSNRAALTLVAASPASLLLRASLMYTDTFLLLSGALAAFHLSKQLARGGGLDWAGRLVTRVVRLTPTLGIVTVAYAYVLEHLGSGPLWGQLVEENARICREHMWRNLLYVHNLWPFEQMCAPHTHQLALDMQLSLLVPPLVWLLVKAWPLASPLVVALVGASTWLRQQAAVQHNVSLLIYNGARPADLYRAADASYVQASHRASAYLIGVALGYLLHRVPRKLQIPKVVSLAGWAACAALGGWALFSQRQVARLDYRFNVEEAARFNALAPLAWAAAMSWLIFACYTNNGGLLDRVLCARPLVLLSRISYAFYLTQFLVFFYNAGSVRSQREFSVLGALDLWELLIVLTLSTLITLLVELPMQSVRSAFASSKRRQSLKWDPPATPSTPTALSSPLVPELAAAYYYNPGPDVYTSRPKVE